MKNKVGPPVEGDDFFGREKELQFAFGQIEDGNSLLLAAPRRVGKTSFAKKLIAMADKKGWRTLEINLEGIRSEYQLIKLLVKELKNMTWWGSVSSTITNKLTKLLEQIDFSIEKDGFTGNIAWKAKRKEVFENLESLFEHNTNTLIMIDELGVLLNTYRDDVETGLSNAESLLNWFRSLRQKSETKIRWVFCSSIGIKNFTNRHNISYTINDIEPFKLKTFDKPLAKDLLGKLAESKGLELPDAIIETMLEKIDWYLPYFIQLLFKEIHRLNQVEEFAVDERIVDIAYDSLIKNQYFNTWDERLKYYYELETTSRKILIRLCKNPEGESRKLLFDLIHNPSEPQEETEKELGQIIGMLSNDGYLNQDQNGKFLFRSPFLRDYWFNKFIR
jgi:nucleoside-triphosphatase THEP1